MMETFQNLYRHFFGPDVFVAPQYLVVWVLLAWLLFRWRKETHAFWAWLLPKRIWQHQSSWMDIKLFVIGRLIGSFGILSRFIATPVVAATVAGWMPGFYDSDHMAVSPIVLALLLFLFSDFAIFLSHWAHHSIKAIWPLHAVHHSAEVLTPITAYRQHPLGILVNVSFQSIVIGGLWGVLIGVLNPSTTFATIAGVNAFVVVANLTITNFHHTHIWVSFGPFWERIFISPSQHQIHHSTDPAHFNKNFGHILAVWDWMFGTLYITQGEEDVTFGLDSKADAPLMTHQLWPIFWSPLKRLFGRAS